MNCKKASFISIRGAAYIRAYFYLIEYHWRYHVCVNYEFFSILSDYQFVIQNGSSYFIALIPQLHKYTEMPENWNPNVSDMENRLSRQPESNKVA